MENKSQTKQNYDVLFARNRKWEIPLEDVCFNQSFFIFIGDNQEQYGRKLGYDFLSEMKKYGMITATRDAPGHMGGDLTYVPLTQGIEWVRKNMVAYFTHWDNDQGRTHNYLGMSVEKYHDYLIETAQKSNEQFGCRKIWLNYGGEADSCFPWPVGKKFSTRKEIFEYFRNRVLSKESRGECFAFWSGWYQHALEKSRQNLRRLPMIWTCAEVHDVHYWFEWGVPFITFETNCWRSLPLNVEMAFARGAARQHNSLWGIDISLWNWPGRLTVYNKLNEWISGNTADYFLRQWMLSYMGGANAVHFEIANSQFFLEKGPMVKTWPEDFGEEQAAALMNEEFGPQENWFYGGGTLVPSEIGNNAIDFNEFSAIRHVDRGEPLRGLGIMLDYHHGWGTSASFTAPPDGRVMWKELFKPRVWGDCVERNAGDDSLDGFFRAAFPRVHKDIMQDEKTVSLSTKEMFEAFWEGRLDPEDYLPGLSDTRWGNHLEVLLDNADPEIVQKYTNLMLLGGIQPEEKTWSRLFEYVRHGGNLVTSVSHLNGLACKQIGLKEFDQLKPGIPHNTVWRSNNDKWGTDRLMYHLISGGSAIPIMQTSTGDNLLLKFSMGSGAVFISAVPHYIDLDGNIAPHFIAFLDDLIKKALPALVSGPAIDFTVSNQGERVMITLLNHHREPWRGYLLMPVKDGLHSKPPMVRDLWRERNIDRSRIEKSEKGWKVDVGIRGRSLAVFEIK
ncbi:MAG: hypothetical protein WC975_00750 [Phycisphaerae bacterium]